MEFAAGCLSFRSGPEKPERGLLTLSLSDHPYDLNTTSIIKYHRTSFLHNSRQVSCFHPANYCRKTTRHRHLGTDNKKHYP